MKQIIYAVDNKSSGFKSILTKIMKLLNDQFAEHLVKVFNLSLKRGVFPDSLKIAKVIPSHKKEVWNSRVTKPSYAKRRHTSSY